MDASVGVKAAAGRDICILAANGECAQSKDLAPSLFYCKAAGQCRDAAVAASLEKAIRISNASLKSLHFLIHSPTSLIAKLNC